MPHSKECHKKISFSQNHRFRKTKFLIIELSIFSYPSVLTNVLGAQKNCLIETFFLSSHNICFGGEIRFFFLNSKLKSCKTDEKLYTSARIFAKVLAK